MQVWLLGKEVSHIAPNTKHTYMLLQFPAFAVPLWLRCFGESAGTKSCCHRARRLISITLNIAMVGYPYVCDLGHDGQSGSMGRI